MGLDTQKKAERKQSKKSAPKHNKGTLDAKAPAATKTKAGKAKKQGKKADDVELSSAQTFVPAREEGRRRSERLAVIHAIKQEPTAARRKKSA